MKQNRGVNISGISKNADPLVRRREMAGFPRFLLILLLLLLIAATAVAAYGYFRPIVIELPTLSYRYEEQINAQYQVQNESSPVMDQTIQGMDMVYLSEFARSVQPVFTYSINADRTAKFTGSYQIIGILRLRGSNDLNSVIYEKQVPLSEKKEINITSSELYLEQSAQVSLADFTALINEFEQESELQANYELDVGMRIAFDAVYNGSKVLSVDERPSIVMPLGSETFTIKRFTADNQKANVWLMQRWQLLLTPLPIWVYPVAGGIGILLLILVLATTKTRRKLHFNRKVRRMQRKARGRLMLIGDKAWEPEWCITVASYKTMVKTARKLKHPIFCYVENKDEGPVAYFYVYYGENNYCYTYYGAPGRNRKISSGSENTAKGSILPDFISSQNSKKQPNENQDTALSSNDSALNRTSDFDAGKAADTQLSDQNKEVNESDDASNGQDKSSTEIDEIL